MTYMIWRRESILVSNVGGQNFGRLVYKSLHSFPHSVEAIDHSPSHRYIVTLQSCDNVEYYFL